MEKTTNRKNRTSKKVEKQSAKTSGQGNPKPVTNDSADNDTEKIKSKNTDTAKDNENRQAAPTSPQEPEKPLNTFATTLADRIMSRIYELYGYSIKGNSCKVIVNQAQKYANANKIKIKIDINTINTHELYPYIVNLISSGYNLSPLDTNYNDIFLRAVVERYKM